MRPFIRNIETLELDGGSLCLDFVNSVRSRFENPLYEFITSPEDWLRWIHRVQLFNDPEEDRLKKYVSKNLVQAANELKRIISVRELLYRIFCKLAQEEIPSNKDLAHFNKELSVSLRYLKIGFTDELMVTENWDDKSFNLLYTLHPLLKSAYDLLSSDTLNRLKECKHCGWIYMDKSKNNSRLWCNMKTCGNTVKTKKYYYKSRTNVIDNPNK
ncbi:MAG: CGNR zinc finger domain-containing protein [Bacteroidales bacterium]